MKKRVTLIEGFHLTATDRRAIAFILDAGSYRGATERIEYQLADHEAPNTYHVWMRRNERDDMNRPTVRKSRAVIRYA